MIAIIDYGMGNLQSIANAFALLGEEVVITNAKSTIKRAKAIVLPGVGAFADGMKNLERVGLLEALREEVVDNKKPYLGICLGMQFLARKSFEHGEHDGFGWIDATVKRIEPENDSFKIPHIGWNDIEIVKNNGIFTDIGEKPVFYFVHSYHVVCDLDEQKNVTSTCWHGTEITASIQKDNIFGVQFHPEKSQGAGLKVLRNFLNYVEGVSKDA